MGFTLFEWVGSILLLRRIVILPQLEYFIIMFVTIQKPGFIDEMIQKAFLVYKQLFKKFLNTKQIKLSLGNDFIDRVQSFNTDHIEPYESHFCF